MTKTPIKKSVRRKPKDLVAAVQERLDATPERLARADEAGETPFRDAERVRRILDPFDTMRAIACWRHTTPSSTTSAG